MCLLYRCLNPQRFDLFQTRCVMHQAKSDNLWLHYGVLSDGQPARFRESFLHLLPGRWFEDRTRVLSPNWQYAATLAS
jgi:hypothetical protein